MKSVLAIGARTFDFALQRQFAALSGDTNPLHLDAEAARRTVFGGCVVHGVHLALWAVDCAVQTGLLPKAGPREITANFLKPVAVDASVEVTVETETTAKLTLAVHSAGVLCARVICSRESLPEEKSAPTLPAAEAPSCQGLSFEQAAEASGSTALSCRPDLAASLFPALAAHWPERLLAALLATTRIVGMYCPGRHSLFSSVQLHFTEAASSAEQLRWRTTLADRRFSLLRLAVEGEGISGNLQTFFRPPPAASPRIVELSQLIAPHEFAGQRALIIGGSRGIGEATVRLIAAGGGETYLTYHRGSADAAALQAEVRAAGARCEIAPFDVLDDAAVLPGDWQPTHLYYFATPRIDAVKAAAFSAPLFDLYSRFYVIGFLRLLHLLEQRGTPVLHVYYPSTVFLDEAPEQMREYCAAKAAGEAVCRAQARRRPNWRVVARRLPRMDTDQTRGLVPISAPPPHEIMLAELRALTAP